MTTPRIRRRADAPSLPRPTGRPNPRSGKALRSGGGRPAAAVGRRDRRRSGAVRELPAVRLVVPGHRRVRAAGLGADPRVDHTRRRIRIRIPVRAGVLPAAAAMDQRAGRRDSVDRSVGVEALFPALFGLWRRRGPAAAGLAVLVRRAVGGPGMAQVDRALRRIPLGGSRFQSDRRPVAGDRAARRCAAAVVRGGADRIQLGGNHFRSREVVAPQRPQPDRGTARGGAARRVHQRRAAADHRWPGRTSGSRVSAPATTRRSPSPPCRATCRGSGWSSTRSAARCSTTTSARRFGCPRTCTPAGRHSRWWSSGRRTPPTSIRSPIRTPASEISHRRGGDQRADPGRWRRRGPRLQPRQPGVDQLGDRLESRNRPGRPARQADRPAVRRVPAVAQLLQPSVAVRRPGRLLRARQRQRGGARRRRARRGDDLLGGDLRPRRARVGAQRRPTTGGADQQRHLRPRR